MKKILNRITKEKISKDYEFRAFLFTGTGSLVTLAFLLYNLYIGIRYQNNWSKIMPIYYFCLIMLRIIILFVEVKIEDKDYKIREKYRIITFHATSFLVFIMTVSLIGPAVLMTKSDKNMPYGLTWCITYAAYAFYKIIMSTIGVFKSKKYNNISLETLKTVNFVDALLSIMSLEYALILVQDSFAKMELFLNTTYGCMIVIAAYAVVKHYISGMKYIKKHKKAPHES